MNEYMAHMIARLEHEERVRSLPRVYEYGYPVVVVQPGWALQWAGRLLCVVGNGLAALRKRMKGEQELSVDTPLVGVER